MRPGGGACVSASFAGGLSLWLPPPFPPGPCLPSGTSGNVLCTVPYSAALCKLQNISLPSLLLAEMYPELFGLPHPLLATSSSGGLVLALENFAYHCGLFLVLLEGQALTPFSPPPAWPNTLSDSPLSSDIGLAQDIRVLGRDLGGSKRKVESTALFLCSHQPALVEPPPLGTWGYQGVFEFICNLCQA